MSVISWLDFFSTAAVIVALVEQLSGTPVCVKYIKKQSTGDASALSFVIGFLSAVWLLYGCIRDARTVMAVNFIGSLLFLCYTGIFFIFTPYRWICLKQFSVAILMIVAALVYVKCDTNVTRTVHVIGIMGNILFVVFCAAPLSMVAHVIKVKNTDVLPFPLILMTCGVSLTWFVYGSLIDDPYIQVPEFLGSFLCLIQLSLFIIYRNRSEPLLSESHEPVVFVVSDNLPNVRL